MTVKCYTFCQFKIKIALLHGSLVGLTDFSWPLNNTGLNCVGPQNTYQVLHSLVGWICSWLNPWIWNHRCFQLHGRVSSPNSYIVQGQSTLFPWPNQFIWPLCSIDSLKVEQLLPSFLGATINRRLFWVNSFEIKDILIYMNHSTFNLSDAK